MDFIFKKTIYWEYVIKTKYWTKNKTNYWKLNIGNMSLLHKNITQDENTFSIENKYSYHRQSIILQQKVNNITTRLKYYITAQSKYYYNKR